MKTIHNVQILLILALATALSVFTSCSDDGDTSKPVITLNEPEKGESFRPGSEMCIDVDFSDNEALKSYSIEIHNNIENPHEHKASRAGDDAGKVYFSYKESFDEIDGYRNKNVHKHIPIPENAIEGEYHLVIYCMDRSGNEANMVSSFMLSHDAEEHNHHDD